MIALLKYKYYAGRRNKTKPLVVWTTVLISCILATLGSFALSLALFHGVTITREYAALGALFIGILVLNFNVSKQSPLNPTFARELEFLVTLPLPTGGVVLTQLIGWVVSNLLVVGIFLLAPTLALVVNGSLPFLWNIPFALVAVLVYSLLLIFAGAWFHLTALRRHAWVTFSILFATELFGILGALLVVGQVSRQLPIALHRGILGFATLPIWPSTWLLEAMAGHWMFWILLVSLTTLIIWQTLPRLSRYWEETVILTEQRSLYPLHILGSRWAIAKFFVLVTVRSPTLQFNSRVANFLTIPLLLWYFLHVSGQALWLTSFLILSSQLGIHVYSHLRDVDQQIAETSLPNTSREAFRGYCSVMGMTYLPLIVVMAMILSLVYPVSLSFLSGLLLGLLGILVLALCAWRHIPILWGFAALAVFEIAASFLI